MKCIFCGQESSYSKSIEHIVPESFGNKTAFLRKGIVCDKCNNYFARKVEQPFLESETVRVLRQELELENKRGKIIKDYTYPRIGKEYVQQVGENTCMIYTKEDKTESDLAAAVAEYNIYCGNTDKRLLEENIFVSRLLAKMAVEYFIYRCGGEDDVCEYVGSDEIFKSIREYARYESRKIWKYNARRIYARHTAYDGDPFTAINWEADLLFLGNGEVYFVIAMYGIEYAINMGGSYIDGYKYWLENNNFRSPLYLSPQEKQKLLMDYYRKISTTTEKVMIYDFHKNGERQ
ncbi:MAG: HNH endonuclease [Christensenella sp.]|nr:HNH endonuclease [Christensenella sp.]